MRSRCWARPRRCMPGRRGERIRDRGALCPPRPAPARSRRASCCATRWASPCARSRRTAQRRSRCSCSRARSRWRSVPTATRRAPGAPWPPWREPPRWSWTGCAPTARARPASRIHWPALARGAGLLERRLRPDGDGRPLVVLDPSGPRRARGPRRRRAGGGIARDRPGASRRLRRAAARRAPRDAHRARPRRLARDVRARLALVEEGPPPPLAGLAHAHGSRLLRRSPRAGARPARARARRPASRVLVVPGELTGRAEVLTVAGCRGYALGRAGSRRPAAAAATGSLGGTT